MKILALLSSMPFESDIILSCMKNVRTFIIAHKKVSRGNISGRTVLLAHTGIGKVNAAHTATCLIERFSVEKIINFGAGGAYPGSGLGIGDVAVAVKENYGDEGVIEARGWGTLEKIGIPVVQAGRKKYFNEFPVGHSRNSRLAGMAEGSRKFGPFEVKTGGFVTVSAVSGTTERAGYLGRKFKAVCENMEGAAIAHVCALYGIPFLEIRGISNMAGVRDRRKWSLERASMNCQEAVIELIGGG